MRAGLVAAGGTQSFRAPAGLRYVRPVHVIVTQFEGATTMRVPPLAAGLLVATARRAHPDVDFDVVVRRREPGAVAAALAVADVLGLSLYAPLTTRALIPRPRIRRA